MIDENTPSIEIIDYLCEQLKREQASILVGAGFSLNADKRSSSAKNYPLWKELNESFAKRFSGSNSDKLKEMNPTILAEYLEAAFGRSELDKAIIEAIPDEQYLPSDLHVKLLRMPWVDVFTTNYDTLLERASESINYKRFKIVTCKEDLVGSSDLPRIIKLHGSLPSRRPFIITSEDYRNYPQLFAPFVNTVQQSMLENTFCMIGFSGDDPNFEKWIGWIRDNLKSNAPLIYLITLDKLSDARIKFLYKRNVVAVSISSFGNDNPSSKFEELFDYILKKVPYDKPSWPNSKYYQTVVQNDLKGNITELLPILDQIRKQYPGWLITPNYNRGMLKNIRQSLERIVKDLKNQTHINEVDFLFGYDWIRERCLLPPFQEELEGYDSVLKRNLPLDKLQPEAQTKMASIILSLMRDCRESGEFEKWNEYNEMLLSIKSIFTHELKQRLSFETCLKLQFTYEYTGFIKEVMNWNVLPQEHLWSLYKGGLLCEINKLDEANRVLSGSLEQLHRQLQFDGKNLYLLSLESSLMALLQHLSSAIRPGEFFFNGSSDGNENPMEEAYLGQRRQIHQGDHVDFSDMNERFKYALVSFYTPPKYETQANTFDFGEKIITHHLGGEDKELVNAISFLRFREETGHPFRIRICVDGVDAAANAAECIIRISPTWAAITLVRANSEKSLNRVFTRSILSSFSADKVNSLALFYYNALITADESLDKINAFYTNDFTGCSASVLPLLLSHLCCKSSNDTLDKILLLTEQIYQSEKRNCYKGVKLLVKHLMKSFSSEEKLTYIQTLLKFPLSIKDDRYNDYIDPMLYIPFLEKQNILDVFIVDTLNCIDELIKTASENDEDGLLAIGRLMLLSNRKMLTKEQHNLFASTLEQHAFNLPHNFYPTSLLFINLNEDVTLKIKTMLKSRVLTALKSSAAMIGMATGGNIDSSGLLLELCNHNIYDADDDISKLLSAIKMLIIKYLEGYSKYSMAGNEIKARIFHLCLSLFHLIGGNSTWIANSSIKSDINDILNELNKKCMNIPYLTICWANKTNTSVDHSFIIHDLLSSEQDRFNGALLTVNLSIRHGEKLGLDTEVKNQCLKLLCEQVKWRQSKYLDSTLKSLNNLFILNYSSMTEEMLDDLSFGLTQLYSETKINIDDSIESADIKGCLRREASVLAASLLNYFHEHDINSHKEVSIWEALYNDPEEFAEIRKAGKA